MQHICSQKEHGFPLTIYLQSFTITRWRKLIAWQPKYVAYLAHTWAFKEQKHDRKAIQYIQISLALQNSTCIQQHRCIWI